MDDERTDRADVPGLPGQPRRRMHRGPRDAAPEVVRITDAADPLDVDIARRSRRYLLQMLVRTACFFGAVFVDHWSRWVLVAGAVLLPYVAVVLANAGRERVRDPGTLVAGPALPPAPPKGPAP